MDEWERAKAREIRQYLRWVRVLEATVPSRRLEHARHFNGNLMVVYTRAGRGNPAFANEPFVCLATIHVKAAFRGMGFLTELLEVLDGAGSQLRAACLAVERAGNPGLARKLESLGFSQVPASEGVSPTYIRRRPG